MTEATAVPGTSFLATRKGQLTLAFLLVVALLDFMGIAIVNVALPSIQRDLHFSQQNLQWVISGYVVTYGGFMLLGGRLADLPGRRVTLVIGTAVFGIAAIVAGAAPNAGTLVGARLAQGLGAALMTPAGLSSFDTLGALLGTGAMLLLIYALVKAPQDGWGSAATIGELAGAGVLLAALIVNELRHPNPVLPLSIFRIKGLAATDLANVLGLAGFNSVFFFITLYMQDVLHFSALRAGAAYVPIGAIVALSSIGGSGLIPRLGTRPVIVAGAVIATGGMYWVSRIPVQGYYWTDIFAPLMIMGFGLGLVFVGVQIAGNAGVPPDKAGLAGALITASFQLGVALGLAILSALATARTSSLVVTHHTVQDALVGGYTRALLGATFFVGAVILIGLRAANTKGEPPGGTTPEITGVAITDEAGATTQASQTGMRAMPQDET